MDYGFCKVTIFKSDMKYEVSDTKWLPLDRISLISPTQNGSVIEYFNGESSVSLSVREAPEGIFNSAVFIKSPSTYFVNPNEDQTYTIDQ